MRKDRSRKHAAESIGIGGVECTGPPEHIADIHQEAIEAVHVVTRVFRRWRGRGLSHCSLKSTFIDG